MMNVIRSTVVLGMLLLATGCGSGPLGGLPLTLLGLPFKGPDDFFDFALSTQAVPTSIPPGVYTGTFTQRTTLLVSDDEQTAETTMNPITRVFNQDGAPLNSDSSPIINGVSPTDNGVVMRFQRSIPIDHPSVEPFDLPLQLTETITINSDGTLEYTGAAVGATSDGFVQLTTEVSGTLSS